MFRADRSIERELFAYTPRDLIPDTSDVWLYIDLFDSLELDDFYAKYSSQGQVSIDCRLMLRTIFFGLTHGICSGRKLEAACQYDNRYLVLIGCQRPAFRTFHRFLQRHDQDMETLFVKVVHLAQKMGLVSLGNVAIDGTRLKANASRRGMLRYEKFDAATLAIKTQINELRTKLAEENLQEKNDSTSTLSKDIATKERRLERIKAAKERLDNEYENEKRKNKTRVALNDTDARFMGKDGAGANFIIGYNGQASVDSDNQIIVAAELQDGPQDAPALIPMIEKTKENCGDHLSNVLVDQGYATSDNLLMAAEKCENLFVALGKGKDVPERRCEHLFESDDPDSFHCLAGKDLKISFRIKDKHSVLIRVPKGHCDGCAFADKCQVYKAKNQERISVLDPKHGNAMTAMLQRNRTDEFHDVYKRRKAIVEPVFGNIKWNKMMRIFVTKRSRVAAWWKMVTTAHNIEKIIGRLAVPRISAI